MKRVILTIMLLFGVMIPTFADGTKGDVEALYKYRLGLDFQIKLLKGLKLDLEPEFRFRDGEGYDKLLLNAGLTYKTFGCIYWGATYRLEVDREESDSSYISNSMFSSYGSNYNHEVYSRFAFDVTYKEEFGRFTPSFRFRYNNFADDEVTDKAFLRYRAKVEYNIRKSKFTPYLSTEAYQDLGENQLYKMRYATGFDLKLSKSTSLGVDYKFDFFIREYKNANIFSAGFKFKL